MSCGGTADAYNAMYRKENYFEYRAWIYRPFLAALVTKAALQHGSKVLDAGCGQGFFTELLGDLGFDVLGVDFSVEGINAAKTRPRKGRIAYDTGDILSLPYKDAFDCVYCRSCSLYNNANLERSYFVTEALLGYVKPGGVLIFDYYTKLSRRQRSSSWTYHKLAEVRHHFARYPRARVYFSLRVEAGLFGVLTLSRPITTVNALISSVTGLGGEAVAMVWKEQSRR